MSHSCTGERVLRTTGTVTALVPAAQARKWETGNGGRGSICGALLGLKQFNAPCGGDK